MIEVTLFGIASSLATEVVTWLNKAWTDTVLHGRGAFFLSLVIALLVAAGKLLFVDHVGVGSWEELISFTSQVWTISQIWFVLIATRLGLDVKE